MTLTPEQSKALDAIRRWLRSTEPQAFSLGGYAGTGKTTLLQYFINGLDAAPLCCAPTGKAASVLAKKLTNATVSTIHRALYCPMPPSMERLAQLEQQLLAHPGNEEVIKAIEVEKERLNKKDLQFSLKTEIQPGQLVIIDESSMVTNRMLKDLLNTGARLLFVGDPGQLPPVNDSGFFAKRPPDVMLKSIQRQALDSPIVRLSMEIREGRISERFDQPGCRRISKDDLAHKDWLSFDQVLTGKNETRRKINRFFRRELGHEGIWPQDGERVICLKNETEGNNFFINGIQCTTLSPAIVDDDTGELEVDLLYESDVINKAPLYMYPFEVHYNPSAIEEPWPARQGLREFDYAYAITVHKSQGSEWDRVLLADDGMMAERKEFRKQWLYTAVTRAKKELVWLS